MSNYWYFRVNAEYGGKTKKLILVCEQNNGDVARIKDFNLVTGVTTSPSVHTYNASGPTLQVVNLYEIQEMNPKHHDSLEPNVLEQRIPASQVQKARTRDMERIERSAREALIRTVGDETRLMDIARSCQSFEEFRDRVSDEFVRGQERIPRMDIGQFAQTTWDYMKMLDGGDLYGDHEMSEAARDAESADAFKEWLTRNRPDLEDSLKKGNELTLETWLRALYQEADGSAEGNVQEATNATAILNEERRKCRERSLDNRFKELVDTDEGLDQVISAFSSDDTQLPPEARIVVEAASQEEVDAAREALKRDPRLYRTLYAEKTGDKAWSSTDLQGEMPMIGDPVGRMRYVMGQSERKRRCSPET